VPGKARQEDLSLLSLPSVLVLMQDCCLERSKPLTLLAIWILWLRDFTQCQGQSLRASKLFSEELILFPMESERSASQ
jgi:hypothetical protein